TVIAVKGHFLTFVGEVVADLKRQDLAAIDADLFRLKRAVLKEKLEEFQSGLVAAVTQQKAKVEQDLISRGLSNTTVRQGMLQAIERDAATESERASREYNRAIEEIALMERRLEVQNRRSWWKKLIQRVGFSR